MLRVLVLVLHILQTDVVAELLIIPRMSCGPTICEFVQQLVGVPQTLGLAPLHIASLKMD